MKKVYLIFVLLAVFANGLAAQEKITIVVDPFPPYQIENAEDGKKGFHYEIVTEAFRRVGISLTIKFFPWERAYKMTTKGEVVGLTACSFKENRLKVFFYSDPITSKSRGFYVRQDFEGSLSSYEDLRGLNVGAILGYAQQKILTEKGIKHQIVEATEQGIKMLVNNRIDIFVTNKETAEFQSLKLGVSDKIKFLIVDRTPYYICFSRKWPGFEALATRFNSGLSKVRQDGTFDKIIKKYGGR